MREMLVSKGYRKRGFDAYAGTILRKEDMAYWMNSEDRVDPEGVAIGLDEKIELVESGFFETVPTLNCLWMENPDCKLQMTDAVVQLLQKNRVILRGWFDSTAEQYARDYRLRFLLLDTELASVGEKTITLRFHEDGSAYIHQDHRCQGSSAGSIGGGELSFDLPNDFYLTMTADQIANRCWYSCRKEMVEDGKLAAVMEKAKQKGGFLLDFSKN